MQAKIRKVNKDGIVRLETQGAVKEVLINEDLLHPDKETISVCFMGKDSSGIIDFTPAEIDKLYSAVKGRVHLIKGLKVFSGNRSEIL